MMRCKATVLHLLMGVILLLGCQLWRVHTQSGGCPMLTAPENGAVTNNTDVDTQANYTCDAGYCLYGNRYRTCQSDGNWTGTEPSCFNESLNCENLDDPMNGRVTNNTAYGSQANYTCNTRYCLNGNRYRTCQCGGNWTGTEPTCVASMDCMRLDDPVNGRVTNNTAYGSQANYTCNARYCLNGNRYRTCQCSGNWTGTEPTCDAAMDCMRLDDPMNGRVTDNTAYGSQANYTCNEGYRLVGDRYRTCQCGWTGTAPLCNSARGVGISLLLLLVSILTARLL